MIYRVSVESTHRLTYAVSVDANNESDAKQKALDLSKKMDKNDWDLLLESEEYRELLFSMIFDTIKKKYHGLEHNEKKDPQYEKRKGLSWILLKPLSALLINVLNLHEQEDSHEYRWLYDVQIDKYSIKEVELVEQ